MMLLAAAHNSSSLVPLYYVIGIIAGVIGVLIGGAKWYRSQRESWTDEAEQATRQADAMAANTSAAAKNTEAITKLTDELRNFMSEMRLRLVGQDGMLSSHENRITRLEQNGHHPVQERVHHD